MHTTGGHTLSEGDIVTPRCSDGDLMLWNELFPLTRGVFLQCENLKATRRHRKIAMIFSQIHSCFIDTISFFCIQ